MAAKVILSDERSIPQVVQAMTLEEKAQLVAGATAFETCSIDRLGIPAFVPADGHNGINCMQLLGNIIPRVLAEQGRSMDSLRELFQALWDLGVTDLGQVFARELDPTVLKDLPPEQAASLQALMQGVRASRPQGELPSCFPPGIVMGATWNPALVGECGRAVAKEAKAFGVDMLLGPNVNIHRDPLGGRVFESYSEDPYLASQMAVGYIQGVQSEGVAADVKHFAANNQEYLRQGIDEIIPERALREIYLPAFKAAVQEGGCWTVMSAYNKINGVDCALNKRLLTEILRDEWGFAGFVVSDWGAAYDRIEALNAGNDLEMPGPQDPQEIVNAVERGALEESVLNDRIANILGVLIRLPAFKGKEQVEVDRPLSARLARSIAVEGAVLLRNENDALPLGEGNVLAVLGENAKNPLSTGGGSAGVLSPYTVSLLEGLEARFGKDKVCFGEIPEDADAVIVSVGVQSGEGSDRESLELAEEDVATIKEAVQACRRKGVKNIVVLNVCGPVEMSEWIDDVDAALLIWLGGMELGHAAAALLSGDENPCGKLPLTFPRHYRDAPSCLNFPGEFGRVLYGEGIYVGYRYYDVKGIAPQFPFGFGLSYTAFELGNLRLSSDTLNLDEDEALVVSVDVTNIGERGGKQVVQFYISDVASTPHKPLKELKGFQKVYVGARETQTVQFAVTRRALQHYDPNRQAWCVEPGMFRVLIGSSAQDISLSGEFRAVGFNPYGYGPETPIEKVMSDERAVAVLQEYLPAEVASPQAMAMVLQYNPHRPLDKVWTEWFDRALGDRSEEEKAEIRRKAYLDLAEVEIWD